MDRLTKFIANGYKYPAKLRYTDDDKIKINFRYNKTLLMHIKKLKGARWQPDDPNDKHWIVENNSHNRFQISYLEGNNPYSKYEQPLLQVNPTRNLYKHQLDAFRHAITRKSCIFAYEMGTGKSLIAIEVMEYIQDQEIVDVSKTDLLSDSDERFFWVAPRSALVAVELELEKWDSKVRPKLMTYEGLKKEISNWQDGKPAPKCIIFDESSKIKNPASQRSKAAFYISECMREEYDIPYLILMSGTPAPKAPTDWWHQCEVACPGFILEGDIHKFKSRLCLMEEQENAAGSKFLKIITWLDDSNKCKHCGKLKDEHPTIMSNDSDDQLLNEMTNSDKIDHVFEESVNEIAKLYKRMQGLVLVGFKKDCLDLPEKRYEQIKIKPTVEMLRVMKSIKETTSRGATALTLLRELSDGFQYIDEKTGESLTCKNCNGVGHKLQHVLKPGINLYEYFPPSLPKYIDDLDDQFVDSFKHYYDKATGILMNYYDIHPDFFELKDDDCPTCKGTGLVDAYTRGTFETDTPKDKQLKDDLADHEEVGRINIFSGFTATIDKIVSICHKENWTTLLCDKRGFIGQRPDGSVVDSKELLHALDYSYKNKIELFEKYPRVAYVGNPNAGGMGLTLTASPTAIYYSNDFNGEARMQSEDRGHRAGMDTNRGYTIKDYICLPTDLYILNNIQKKKDLQAASMGEIKRFLDNIGGE